MPGFYLTNFNEVKKKSKSIYGKKNSKYQENAKR